MIRKNSGNAGGWIRLLAVWAATAGGCVATQPAPGLPAESLFNRQANSGTNAGQAIDQPGSIVAVEHPQHEAAGGTPISATVRESVNSPDVQRFDSTTAPAAHDQIASLAAPATSPGSKTGVSTGQWQSIGSVLAVVNGEPIYSDKVVDAIERALRAEAKSGSEDHFRMVAQDLVVRQVHEFYENDLEYAAAQKALEKQDIQIATLMTTQWRKDQIRAAGGSEAIARQRAADEGLDFEELARQQYRINLTRIYYQKKIFPLIQVSAQDMRDYYDSHPREFQKSAAARFLVIWVSTESAGGRREALDKATQIYQQAKAGADFSELASKASLNDDAAFQERRGAVGNPGGWVEKGEFFSDKVENAVWQLTPGKVSTPIDGKDRGHDGFFVAKLQEIQPGKVDAFENERVQASIYELLRRQQFATLRLAHRQALLNDAVKQENPHMLEVAMALVMQRYESWRASH